MSNPQELHRILEFWGPQTLRNEAAIIEPRFFNSYSGNIAFLAKVHFTHLKWIRNAALLVALADVIASYLLGPIFLAITLSLFALPGLLGTSSWTKNNNVTHLHSVAVNLLKWHTEDAAGCSRFCTEEFPVLAPLYKELITVVSV
jgi:hypothetical protein